MKIGFFTDGYLPQPNGVAISVATCAKALQKRGHEVFIVAPKQSGYKDEKNVFRLTSVKIQGKGDFRLALNLPEKPLRQILKINFDIIHGHAGGPVTLLGWQISRIKNVPFVGTYHTLWNRYTHYVLKGKLVTPKMAEVASKIFGNLCDLLIAPTPRVREELISYGVTKPIAVVGSGLDLARFAKAKKGFLRGKLNLGKEEKILLFVGRLGKEKSADFLIKAFKAVLKENPKTSLVLVGDGSDKAKLEAQAKNLKIEKSVLFPGFVDPADMPEVYADADIFVFASQTETQGLVIPEAFASGLPAVVVEDPAFEGVVKDGYNGFLVERDTKAFAQKVSFLLQNTSDRERFSQNAASTAEEFSVEVMAEKLEKLYKGLVAKYKRRKLFPERIKDLRSVLDLTTQINKLKNIFISPYLYFGGKSDG